MFAEPNYPDKSLIEKFPACYDTFGGKDSDDDGRTTTRHFRGFVFVWIISNLYNLLEMQARENANDATWANETAWKSQSSMSTKDKWLIFLSNSCSRSLRSFRLKFTASWHLNDDEFIHSTALIHFKMDKQNWWQTCQMPINSHALSLSLPLSDELLNFIPFLHRINYSN